VAKIEKSCWVFLKVKSENDHEKKIMITNPGWKESFRHILMRLLYLTNTQDSIFYTVKKKVCLENIA